MRFVTNRLSSVDLRADQPQTIWGVRRCAYCTRRQKGWPAGSRMTKSGSPSSAERS